MENATEAANDLYKIRDTYFSSSGSYALQSQITSLCGLNVGYTRSKRPAIGVAITIPVAIAAPVLAAVYTILSPLGKMHTSDTSPDEESQIESTFSPSISSIPFLLPKHLQSADHICKPLQQKRWTKRLQSARRRLHFRRRPPASASIPGDPVHLPDDILPSVFPPTSTSSPPESRCLLTKDILPAARLYLPATTTAPSGYPSTFPATLDPPLPFTGERTATPHEAAAGFRCTSDHRKTSPLTVLPCSSCFVAFSGEFYPHRPPLLWWQVVVVEAMALAVLDQHSCRGGVCEGAYRGPHHYDFILAAFGSRNRVKSGVKSAMKTTIGDGDEELGAAAVESRWRRGRSAMKTTISDEDATEDARSLMQRLLNRDVGEYLL
ncbi:hypothetical protein LXL04_027903 [Taraxacum kok-saghyz]